MNKTLLIIICDFLLISILALVEFKPQVEVKEPDAEEIRENAADEMLELLKLSLEQENAERQAVEAALDKTENALQETTETLQKKEASLAEKEDILAKTVDQLSNTSETLQSTRQEKEAIASELMDTRSSLKSVLTEQATLNDTLRQREARTRQLQEELAQQQQETAAREEALRAAKESLQNLELTQQKLSTQLQIRETETAILQENLVAARAEVERARVEAERAQQRTESLAAGVSELAASSTELKAEIQRAQPVSMNALYKKFEENRIGIRFQWREKVAFGTAARESRLQSLLLRTEEGVWALFSREKSPLDKETAQQVRLILEVGEKIYAVRQISELDQDSRVAAFRVPAAIAEAAAITSFSVAEDPYRFAEAILISDEREVFGQIPVRLPPGESGLIETESRLFNRLFGEFSPSPGDYVFSLTGELIGIMVSPNRARILETPTFVPSETLESPPSQ